MLDENEAAFEDSLYKDIRKPKQETLLGELAPQKQEIEDSIKSLDKWAKDESVKTGLAFKLTSAHIRKEPLGAVLIIGAWNYPISLLLGPMIGAIAAGNTIVAKPSEVSAHTAALIAELGPKYLDPEAFIFVNGAVPETTKLLELKWDLIFYTGNGTVGRIVATAAAKHLTPTVLELGGKSPAIIAKDTDVQTTARRLVWGKFFNNGQTCIAPDYVLVEESVKEPVVKAMQGYIKEFFGEDPQKSDSYGRIVNGNHFKRLTGLVAESKGSVLAHKTDETDNYISPTLVTDVTADDKLMAGEIFGPILPIMTVKNIDEAVNYINAHDQPLALYTFSKSKATIKNVMDRTRSGAALGNDSLMHFTVPTLPFGGVGPSGQGAYHGKQSFDTFSHHRASLTQPFGLEKALDARYPPYNAGKLKMLNAVLFGVLPFGKSIKTGFRALVVAIIATVVYRNGWHQLLMR